MSVKLKYLYRFWGKVKHGQNRGKRLGFPTANIRLHKKIPEGIYISETKVKDITYPSLTFIGRAKTFDENIYQAETYVLNFNRSIDTVVIPARRFFEVSPLGGKAGIQKKNFLDSHLHENDRTKTGNTLYGRWISIRLIKKIRENKKFGSEKDLTEQMKKDRKTAEEYFRISNS